MLTTNIIRVDAFYMKYVPDNPHFWSSELKYTTRRDLTGQLKHMTKKMPKLRKLPTHHYNPILWLNETLLQELKSRQPLGTIMVVYYWSITSGVREAFSFNGTMLPKLTLLLLPDTECWYGTNGSRQPYTLNAQDHRQRSCPMLPITCPGETPSLPESDLLMVACNEFHNSQETECTQYRMTCNPLESRRQLGQNKRWREDDDCGGDDVESAMLLSDQFRVPAVQARHPQNRKDFLRELSRIRMQVRATTILE